MFVEKRCRVTFGVIVHGKWGWKIDQHGNTQPIWTTLSKASHASKKLKNSKCKELCSSEHCTWKSYRLPCIELCRCQGYCED